MLTRKPPSGKSGRPPKFRCARRPITVTLPEDTLARLASIDADRARAIAKATDAALATGDSFGDRVDSCGTQIRCSGL